MATHLLLLTESAFYSTLAEGGRFSVCAELPTLKNHLRLSITRSHLIARVVVLRLLTRCPLPLSDLTIRCNLPYILTE